MRQSQAGVPSRYRASSTHLTCLPTLHASCEVCRPGGVEPPPGLAVAGDRPTGALILGRLAEAEARSAARAIAWEAVVVGSSRVD